MPATLGFLRLVQWLRVLLGRSQTEALQWCETRHCTMTERFCIPHDISYSFWKVCMRFGEYFVVLPVPAVKTSGNRICSRLHLSLQAPVKEINTTVAVSPEPSIVI